MAYLRRQLLLGLIAILIMPVVAQGQASVGCAEFDATDSETMFTSEPAGEPSLFQSQLQQKNEDLEKRVQRLEEELYSRNRQPSAGVLTRLEQSLQSQEVGTGGLFADVEVTFLRPHLSGAVGAFGHGPTVHRIITSDYTTGVRYGLGYMTDSGVGIRGRYWSMDDDYQYVDPFSANRLGLRLDVADLEMVLNQRLRHWDMQISGGVRYAKLKYDNANATLFGPGTLTFEGFGPTGRFDARRWLGNSGVSVFGNLRGAVLIGDIRNAALLTYMPATTIEEEVMTILENQLGVAWTRQLNSSFLLEIRGAWETQYWMSNTISDDVYGLGSNLALTGPTVAVELRY